MRKREDRPQGPSAGELRLRGELDALRRQLSRLKKEPERRGADGADAPATGPRSAVPVPPDEIHEATPAPASPAMPAGDAAARSGAEGGAEIQRLRVQVAELTSAKQRLSRLYFSQLDEHRQRQRRQRELLDAVRDMESEPDATAWLGRLAESIRRGLGFEVVDVWVREPDAPALRLAATAGAARSAPRELAVSDLLATLRAEFRVSDSYFVSQGGRAASPPPGLSAADATTVPALEWRDEDVLHVPLRDRDGELTACLTLRRPKDGLVPSQDVVELLEIHAHLVATALGAARLRAEMAKAQGADAAATRLHGDVRRLQVQFAATVSREMRTPIAALRLHTEALRAAAGEAAGETVKQVLAGLGEETQRLARLVESVQDLDGARAIGDGSGWVDLLEVVREAAGRLEPVARPAEVTVKVVAGTADTALVADREPIRHLALCLGGHAVRLAPSGGCVTMRVAGDDAEIVLEVTRPVDSTGEGAGSSRARSGDSVADLAACRSILHWHRGRLERSATADGERFVARLPRRNRPRVLVHVDPEPRTNTGEVLGLGIEMVAEVMGARVVSILCPDAGGELVIRAALGLDERVVSSTRIRPGTGVAGWVAENRRPVCVSGVEEHSEITGSGRDLYRSRTFLSVPVESGGELLGVLNVTDPEEAAQFGAEDCHLLLQLAECIAAAWRRALAARQGQAGVEDAATTLQDVIRHLASGRRLAPDRVRLARAIARALGRPETEIGAIGFAASIHDIGMTDPDRSLGAADTLDAVRRHPQDGADALRPLEILGEVRDIVLSHHEWWDGSGYPRGLKGEDIPLGGRILAVVDAYESMTVGRPHRGPMNRTEALAELAANGGRQFDPKVVDACARALDEMEPETAANEAARAAAALADTRR